jgi:serine/threonine protein kinase
MDSEFNSRPQYDSIFGPSVYNEEEQKPSRGLYDIFLLLQRIVPNGAESILEFPIHHSSHRSEYSTHLGAGGFSSVSRVLGKERWGRQNVVAIKRASPSFDEDGNYDENGMLRMVIKELEILSCPAIANNPHIALLRGLIFEPAQHRSDGYLLPALVFEASSIGDLLSFVSDSVRQLDGPYWEFCLDVAQGLEALHESGYIHGDVKCENVLIFSQNDPHRPFIAKLTDFGCSIVLADVGPSGRLRGGTPPYDAPESDTIIPQELMPSTDLYSYGLLVWRVALAGVDVFDCSRYTDDGGIFDYAAIREEKRNENLLHRALEKLLNLDLDMTPETAEAFCEILSIALAGNPQQRDIKLILGCFDRNRP